MRRRCRATCKKNRQNPRIYFERRRGGFAQDSSNYPRLVVARLDYGRFEINTVTEPMSSPATSSQRVSRQGARIESGECNAAVRSATSA